MEIKDKFFQIELTEQKAVDIINKKLKAKGYKEKIALEDLYLTITPYWVCFYDILKPGEFEHISGQTTINATNNNINDKVIELFKFSKPRIYDKVNLPRTQKIKFYIKEPIISKEEAESTVIKHLIQAYQVEENGISLSGVERIYVPTWKTRFKKYKIRIDAIVGKVDDLDKIPTLQKTQGVLFNEMISDLKSPKKIGNYFWNSIKLIFEAIYWILKMIVKEYKIILLIAAITLIVYLLFL